MKSGIHILISLIFVFSSRGHAQNLVPNPSFEQYAQCPDTAAAGLGFDDFLDPTWFQFNSADYFNSCDTLGFFGVPMNFIGGYQFPRTGNGYVGLTPFRPAMFGREYIEVDLTTPLTAGQTYYVQYFVNLAGQYRVAIENMGALFTDTVYVPWPPPSYTWVTGTPQIENAPGNMLSDPTGCIEVLDSFVGAGGERYMTIGNFRDDPATVYQSYFTGTGYDVSYYFIDDVYLGTTPPVGIKEVIEI